MARDLEDMFEPQEWNETFATERQVEASDKGAITVEAKSNTVADLRVAK